MSILAFKERHGLSKIKGARVKLGKREYTFAIDTSEFTPKREETVVVETGQNRDLTFGEFVGFTALKPANFEYKWVLGCCGSKVRHYQRSIDHALHHDDPVEFETFPETDEQEDANTQEVLNEL